MGVELDLDHLARDLLALAVYYPDLILLDVMMPVVDGFTVLKTLRQSEQFKSTPIIVYSNLGQEAESKRALELGATEFITKANISPTELVNKIKSVI